jgi:hypothetical protein
MHLKRWSGKNGEINAYNIDYSKNTDHPSK